MSIGRREKKKIPLSYILGGGEFTNNNFGERGRKKRGFPPPDYNGSKGNWGKKGGGKLCNAS